ncbi:transmembrane 7 superfamily member 3-like [Babylonia areolata]|uniref:transmembrane 7 superfamily member 3-like n=1 Tax=Babylonia areolata TaxID=304850 RepID=UPI003FD6A7F2
MTVATMHMFLFLAVFPCLVSPAISQTTTEAGTVTTHQLSPGTPRVLSIATQRSLLDLTLTGVSPTSNFIIIQVHTQHAVLLLTQTSVPSGGRERGSSVGMVQMMNGPTSTVKWRVGVVGGSISEDDFPVSVLAVVQEYAQNVPVPGGCNQVFALETDPNIQVTHADYHSQVWFQWANVGTPPGEVPPSCEAPVNVRHLRYEVYVAYTSENDGSVDGLFDTVRSLMSVEGTRKKAVKVSTIENDGTQKSLVKVTSQRGQGAVYGVVVTDTVSGGAAAYVAAVSYACNYTAGDCSLKHDAVEWVMVVVCGVAGLVLLTLGHNFLRTEMVVVGFLAVGVVSFILLSLAHSLSEAVRLGVAAGLGALGGVGWLLVWVFLAFPSISVLLPGLCAGFLVAGALFFTPFANMSWWASELNYGLVFVCFTLLFGVIFLCSPRTLNIVSCSLVGGYCVTMVPAIALRSSLRLIVLNVIHHASVSGYASIVVVPPFLINDIILAVLWAVLMVAGICWQFYRARGKPHFPEKDRLRRSSRRDHRVGREHPVSVDDERAPLLGNQPSPLSYSQAMGQPPFAPETNRPM